MSTFALARTPPFSVLVSFWAPWFPPCRALATTIEVIAARFDGAASGSPDSPAAGSAGEERENEENRLAVVVRTARRLSWLCRDRRVHGFDFGCGLPASGS